MGFKNLTKYVSTCYEFYAVLATRATTWELMFGRISFPTLLYGFLEPSIVNRTQIAAFSLVFIFSIRLLRYTGAVPFSTLNVRNMILYNDLKRTGSQCSWNITGVICSLFECISPDVQHSSALAVGGWSERGRYYRVMHCHSSFEK